MNYTPGIREVLKLSKAEAGRLNHNYIGSEHYQLAIIRRGKGIAFKILADTGVDMGILKGLLEEEIGAHPPVVTELYTDNVDARRVLEAMKTTAIELDHPWCCTGHLLLGLLMVEGTISHRCLSRFQMDYYQVKAAISAYIGQLEKE